MLNLDGNNLKGAGMITIVIMQHNTNVIELHINDNDITEIAADDIAAGILENSKLQILQLGGNDFKAFGINQITKALQKISSLTELHINNNCMTEKADDIADIYNHQLQNLDGNSLKDAGMITIAIELQHIYIFNLIELHINDNDITEVAADDIAAVIQNNSKL